MSDTPSADDDQPDPFTEALMEAMLTPIGDRANASALVPLVVVVPDEVTDKFNYLTFAKPLDTEARPLRDEAIRRLALGQDAPPELLLGTAGMNHWGAWLVREDVISTHIEPPLALVCDALTTQYLWPALRAMGHDDAEQYVIWYDVSHMVLQPNKAEDAFKVYDRGGLSDNALRDATGFDEDDAPITDSLDYPTSLALQWAQANPTLLITPGLAAVVTQIREVIAGNLSAAQDAVPANKGENPTPVDMEPGVQDQQPPAPPKAGTGPEASPSGQTAPPVSAPSLPASSPSTAPPGTPAASSVERPVVLVGAR